jgi:pilus assembly protein FimV
MRLTTPLEESELDLDLGNDGEALGTPTDAAAIDNDLEFDLSDFEDDAPPKAGAEASNLESADMELEFEVETDSQAEQTMEDEGLAETVAIPEPAAGKTEEAPPEPKAAAAPAPAPKPVKKGVSKSLVFLLIHRHPRRWRLRDLLYAEPERHRDSLSSATI